MTGFTEHIFKGEISDIQAEWKKELISISGVLPKDYAKDDIILALKTYYPHEWNDVEYKKQYYDKKDKYIIRHKTKARYNMKCPEILLEDNSVFRELMMSDVRSAYSEAFSEKTQKENKKSLFEKRYPKIKKINEKISKAIAKTQTVTPDFLDKLIGLYERKSTSQKDKVYIIYELMKYYNPKVINFFFKCNDTELNIQLREIALRHLQSFNYKPRLRKQKYMIVSTKNKKRREYLTRIYPYETYDIAFKPEELEYRIFLGREQQVKSFRYFISHSSADAETVQKLIDYENGNNVLVFCDWINDADYLKRNLICEATLKVIEARLRQSDEMIFVKSKKSLESVWCQYELNYFHELGRPIYVIEKDSVDSEIYELKVYPEEEYLNSDYRELVLINQKKDYDSDKIDKTGNLRC